MSFSASRIWGKALDFPAERSPRMGDSCGGKLTSGRRKTILSAYTDGLWLVLSSQCTFSCYPIMKIRKNSLKPAGVAVKYMAFRRIPLQLNPDHTYTTTSSVRASVQTHLLRGRLYSDFELNRESIMQQVYSISLVLESKTRREHRAYQYNSLSYTREKMKDIGAQNGGMNMLKDHGRRCSGD